MVSYSEEAFMTDGKELLEALKKATTEKQTDIRAVDFVKEAKKRMAKSGDNLMTVSLGNLEKNFASTQCLFESILASMRFSGDPLVPMRSDKASKTKDPAEEKDFVRRYSGDLRITDPEDLSLSPALRIRTG